MKTRELKKPSVRRWLLSYLVILTFPLLLSIVIYLFSRQIIFRTSAEVYTSTLEQAQNEVDSQISALYRVLDHLTVSENMKNLGFVQDGMKAEDYFTTYKLVAELRNSLVIYPLVDDAVVTLNHFGTVAGKYGHMSLDLFVDLSLAASGISRDEFNGLMRRAGAKTVYPLRDKLFVLQGLQDGNVSAGMVTVALIIPEPAFRDRLLKNFAAGGSILYLTGDGGRIISASVDDKERPLLEGLTGAGETVWFKGVQYYTLHNRSALTGWDFHYLVPIALQNQRARQIQLFTLAGLVLCSFFGLFFSIRMTRRNYGQYHSIETSLAGSMKVLQTYYLYTLLEKPFDPGRDGEEMARYSIHFSGEFFQVILFAFPGEEAGGAGTEAARRVLAEAFLEAAARRFYSEITGAGRNLAALVNWSGTEDLSGPLEEAIEAAQQKIAARFSLPVSAALGESRRGPEGIYYSNLEARETLQYLDIRNGPGILHYRDIRYSGERYQYPLEREQRLINFLRLGDEDQARALLRQVFNDNLSQTGFSGPAARLLAFDLLGTLMKGKLSETEPPLNESLPGLEQAAVKDLSLALEKILGEICRANRSILEQKNSRRLGEKIKAYINENFTDPDLNISITAYHFGLSPAYLSGIFREETGLNLLEYINTLRVEEGKRLLAEGQSIIKTAELAGFRGSSTFIRIFRKITGVTPGQYKGTV